MATKTSLVQYDSSYYQKVMGTLFPHYKFNPDLMIKPTNEFVLDIMELFANYFIDFSSKVPTSIDPPKDYAEENIQMNDGQTAAPTSPWELLAKCNEILRLFLGPECTEPTYFDVGDIVSPSQRTVYKIALAINFCVHMRDLDFTEEFQHIQQILETQKSVQDYDQLIKKKMDLEVASESLEHKLDKLKTKDEIEVLSNAYLAETAKNDLREEQLKKEYDHLQSMLLQRQRDQKRIADSIKNLDDKLIYENKVDALKIDLQALKIKKEVLSTDGETLVSKSNNTRVTKGLLEFQLNKLSERKETLKQYEDYRKEEDDLNTKLKNNSRLIIDLLIQIDNFKKDIKFITDDMKVCDWKEKFRSYKTKILTEIELEDKKHDELKSSIDKLSANLETVITSIDIKCQYNEKLISDIQNMDTELRDVVHTMINRAKEACSKYKL